MDHYSEMPHPSIPECIEITVNYISNKEKYENLDSTMIRNITTQYFSNIDYDSMGSLASWMVFGMEKAVKEVSLKIDSLN